MKQKGRWLNKLKNKMMMNYMIIFIILMFSTALLVFGTYKNQMIHEIGATRVDVLRQIGERTNSINNSLITISNLYAINSDLNKALPDENASISLETKSELNRIKAQYDTIFNDIGISYEIVIIGDNGFNYSSKDGDKYEFEKMSTQLWYRRNLESKDIQFISSFKDVYGEDKSNYVFSLFKVIREQGEKIGTLMININEQYLSQTYKSVLNEDNNIYIVDNKGNIVSHKDESMRGINFIDTANFKKLYEDNSYAFINKLNQQYLLTNYYDVQTGWRIIEEIPSNVIFSSVYYAFLILSILVLCCIIIAFFVSYKRSKAISQPILDLCDSMEEIIQGNLDVKSQASGFDEINQLNQGFNEMVTKIKTLMEDIKVKESNKRKSELDFLRAQINPHFLYNTLFSIKCLVEIGKNEQAATMMQAFIDLLKLTLKVDTNFITLKDEVEATSKYIRLQQFRYSDQITYEIDIDEELMQYRVPSLILQPIVENALFHGLEPKNECGTLVMSATVNENILYITITDDGVGIEEEKLEHLLSPREYELKENKSIALANIDHRLKIHFGQEYGLSLSSIKNMGTTVTIRMPIVRE